MATRRSSGSRRSSPASATSAPRGGRDGKIQVYCPQCGTAFKIPEDNLDVRLKCSHCSRLFVAQSALKPPNKDKEKQVYWMIGAGVLLIIAVAVGIKMSGDSKASDAVEQPTDAPRRVALDEKNPRVQDIKTWFDAMSTGKEFDIERKSDLDKLKNKLGIAPGKTIANLPEPEKLKVKTELFEALTKGELTEPFRWVEWNGGELSNEAMVTSTFGDVYADVSPRDPKKWKGGRIKIEFETTQGASTAKVVGWEWVTKPEVKVETRAPGVHKSHEKIGKAKEVERTIAGRQKKVREAEIVPLDHLPDTPEPLRKEIDQLIASLVDPQGDPRQQNKVRARLKEIGKPAIPRLLTKFSEIPGKSHDEIMSLNVVVRLLNDLSGQAFGYSPDDSSANDEQRMSALRQYYGWWTDNHDRYTGPPDMEEEDIGKYGRGKPSRPNAPSETAGSKPGSK